VIKRVKVGGGSEGGRSVSLRDPLPPKERGDEKKECVATGDRSLMVIS
jgi:hypothetical protein